MKALVSFVGLFDKHLAGDRRWLGVIEGPSHEGPLSFKLLNMPVGFSGNPKMGGTGLAANEKFVVSALQWYNPSYVVLDHSLKVLAQPETITADVHSIAIHNGYLYATATREDRVLRYDLPHLDNETEVFTIGHKEPAAIGSFHHLNSVAFGPAGKMYVGFHLDPRLESSRALALELEDRSFLPLNGVVRRMHSLEVTAEGQAAYCHSPENIVFVNGLPFPTVGYARGLALAKDYLIAGSSRVPWDGRPEGGKVVVQIFNYQGDEVARVETTERWEIYDILILEE